MDPQRLLLAVTGQAAAAAIVSSLPALNSKGFKQLLDTQSLVDCTLACNGGKISAHKIVLSACSSYLARILLEHPTEHPIIILPELSIEDVRTLVHYMYTGELLKSNKLNSASLLRTAAILSINSLNDLFASAAVMQQQHRQQQLLAPNDSPLSGDPIENISNNHPQDFLNSFTSDLLQTSSAIQQYSQQQQQQQQDHLYGGTDSSSPPPLIINEDDPQSSPRDSQTPSAQQTQNAGCYMASTGKKHQKLSHLTASTQTSSNNSNNTATSISTTSSGELQFKCQICQNDFQTICSFEYHMQRAHNVTSFGCEICHKPFASLRYVLTDHMRRCHGWRPSVSAYPSSPTGQTSSRSSVAEHSSSS